MSLIDEPAEPLRSPPGAPLSPRIPTVTWSWRTATAAGLALAAIAVYVYALASRPAPPPPEHVNAAAGFSIQPPEGWTDRLDDRDGSFIRPAGPGADRRSSITVSARLDAAEAALERARFEAAAEARRTYARLALADMQARPVTGPIRDLVWLETQRVTLDSGLPAVLAEFTQVYRGVPVHGWTIITVDGARLYQAVGVVPETRIQADQLQLVAALHSLSPLGPATE